MDRFGPKKYAGAEVQMKGTKVKGLCFEIAQVPDQWISTGVTPEWGWGLGVGGVDWKGRSRRRSALANSLSSSYTMGTGQGPMPHVAARCGGVRRGGGGGGRLEGP